MSDAPDEQQRICYVAHAGFLDLLHNGFRKHLGSLTFADIKILRFLIAARDGAELETIVSAVVATTIQELNTSERSARERIKSLQLDGHIEARQGQKGNQTLLQVSSQTRDAWHQMEAEFLSAIPEMLSVIDYYKLGANAPPSDCSDSWKLCDPLHPEHRRMITPRSFTQRGH